MYQFFADKTNFSEDSRTLRITGEDFHHIARVLRMREGSELAVRFNDDPAEYRFLIEEITADAVICALAAVKEDTAELPARITLLQALPKSDKMEHIIQKTTELGISEIIPVICARCVARPDEKKLASRVIRWNKIAEASAKQSRRAFVPDVRDAVSFAGALDEVMSADLKLLPYEMSESGMARTHALLGEIRPGQHVVMLVGPEGGFSGAEVSAAVKAGFESITMGGRILRTETAGTTLLSWIGYELMKE